MLVIGLTGGIGSGKSQVASMFEQLDVPVIDTDQLARQLVQPGQPAYQEIISAFGNITHDDGQLNRQKLRQLVFESNEKRQRLENILHPRIRDSAVQQLSQLNTSYAIIVIPLLTEGHHWPVINRVLVIDCDEEIQKQRVIARDDINLELVEKIIRVQAPRQQRLAIADDVIINESNVEELQQQVNELDKKYRQIASETGI